MNGVNSLVKRINEEQKRLGNAENLLWDCAKK